MDETNTNTEPQNKPEMVPSESIPGRMAVPLLLFSASLTALLLISLVFIVPRFTKINVAGEYLSPKKAAQVEQTLKASLTKMEDDRRALVLPAHDELYETLKQEKNESPTLDEVHDIMRSASVSIGEVEAVRVTHVVLNGDVVEVTGDVYGVGLRSMTVLAAFTEALADDDRITSFKRPQFTRQEDAQGEAFSPFTISFSLTAHN